MNQEETPTMKYRTITHGLLFPEGPIAMPDGSVLLVEIARGTLTRVYPDGRREIVADTGGGPNGAAIGPDGKCYICNNGGFRFQVEANGNRRPVAQSDDYVSGRIERVDLETGGVEVLYDACDGRPLRGPNDIVFARDGGFWFTDLGKARDREMDRGRRLLRPPRRQPHHPGGRPSIPDAPTESASPPTRRRSTWPRPRAAGCGRIRSSAKASWRCSGSRTL